MIYLYWKHLGGFGIQQIDQFSGPGFDFDLRQIRSFYIEFYVFLMYLDGFCSFLGGNGGHLAENGLLGAFGIHGPEPQRTFCL